MVLMTTLVTTLTISRKATRMPILTILILGSNNPNPNPKQTMRLLRLSFPCLHLYV
jgi:hypothetical protein